MPTVLPHTRAGKLRALATTGEARAAATPELPTVAETLPGFVVNNWVGLFAPAGTPADVVAKLNAETRNFMQSKDIGARLASEGARFVPMTPGEFGGFVKAEIAKWAPVVKASGAKAD
jgi:tripartite-type tricarboxylate transporter receptor subunit TctC